MPSGECPVDSAKLALPNRSFGVLFGAVFIVLAGLNAWRGGSLYPLWAALACVSLALALLAPAALTPLTRAWLQLGELLHRVVSPIVLGLIFFGLITPVGAVMRLARRDTMKRRFEPDARTYWIERDPPGPEPAGLPNQF